MNKITVELGGRVLEVRPANLRTVKRWLKAQAETRVGTLEYMEEVSAFVFGALARGNPDLSQEWLEEQLDELNIATVIGKVYEAGRIAVGEQSRPPESR
jgi:hypothetical protein